MSEDGEEDAVHGCPVLEYAHRPGPPADLAEAALDGICGSELLAFFHSPIAPAGKQLVEVVAQAFDGFGVIGLPSVGEAPGGGPGLAHGPGVQDGMQAGLDCGLVGATDLVDAPNRANLNRSWATLNKTDFIPDFPDGSGNC